METYVVDQVTGIETETNLLPKRAPKEKSILIVDDFLTGSYGMALEGTGKIYKATSQRDAYKILSNERIDVVSLDNNFPITDGMGKQELGNSTANTIKEEYGIPIFGFSAFPNDFDEQLFDGVYSKNEITPHAYREIVSGETEPNQGDNLLFVLGGASILYGAVKRSLESSERISYLKVESIEGRVDFMENRDQFKDRRAIVVIQKGDDFAEEKRLIQALWGTKYVEHNVIPIREGIEPILTPIIAVGVTPRGARKRAIYGLNQNKYLRMPSESIEELAEFFLN